MQLACGHDTAWVGSRLTDLSENSKGNPQIERVIVGLRKCSPCPGDLEDCVHAPGCAHTVARSDRALAISLPLMNVKPCVCRRNKLEQTCKLPEL